MKHTRLLWAITILMLCCFALIMSSPAMAEAADAPFTPLPLDILEGGRPAKAEGWNANHTAYTDSTISITMEKGTYTPTMNERRKNVEIETVYIHITVKDASQIRSAMSFDSYKKREYQEADKMARKKNAIVAVNGDFFKYYNNAGYVVRQGEFYRDATGNKYQYDMLVIDSAGDLWLVKEATTDKINAFLENELPEGRTIINTFNVGPALVINGEVQDMADTVAARRDMFQWNIPQQRIAIVQLGPLEYAIVETFGHYNGSQGLQLQEFAQFVQSLCPNAILAYNLDGGGSTNVVIDGTRVIKTPGRREISDILYFASAEE